MKMTIVYAIFSVAIISGCSPETSEISSSYSLPIEMKDCQLYQMSSSGLGRTLYVVRCPDTTTTSEMHQCGKSCTDRSDVTSINYSEHPK